MKRRTFFAIALWCTAIPAQAQTALIDDPIKALVGRLDLESYKAVIKGLTQFGDRQQGTDRNQAAVSWIETQLRAAGCTNVERFNMSPIHRRHLNRDPRQRLSR
jgi:hypothetical protein